MIEASGLKMIAVEDFDLAARTVCGIPMDNAKPKESECTQYPAGLCIPLTHQLQYQIMAKIAICPV